MNVRVNIIYILWSSAAAADVSFFAIRIVSAVPMTSSQQTITTDGSNMILLCLEVEIPFEARGRATLIVYAFNYRLSFSAFIRFLFSFRSLLFCFCQECNLRKTFISKWITIYMKSTKRFHSLSCAQTHTHTHTQRVKCARNSNSIMLYHTVNYTFVDVRRACNAIHSLSQTCYFLPFSITRSFLDCSIMHGRTLTPIRSHTLICKTSSF